MHNHKDIHQFLIIYDRKANQLLETRDLGTDPLAAAEIYTQTEHLHENNPHIDIVLLGAESVETLKKTHSTYFQTLSVKEAIADVFRSLGLELSA